MLQVETVLLTHSGNRLFFFPLTTRPTDRAILGSGQGASGPRWSVVIDTFRAHTYVLHGRTMGLGASAASGGDAEVVRAYASASVL